MTISGDSTTRSRNQHVSSTSGGPEQILRNSRAATADSTSINVADYIAV